MRVWGDVFPDGKVPVMGMTFRSAYLEPHGREDVIMVNLLQLSKEQLDGVVSKISERCGAPKDVVLKDVYRIGLPLRKSYTTDIVAAKLRFFI